MPIYEYRCPTCGADFERMQKYTDPTPVCPTCGGADVRKKVSASAFVLKGSGWYKDHYGLKKSSEGKSEGGSEGAAAPKAAESTSSGTPSASGASTSTTSSGS